MIIDALKNVVIALAAEALSHANQKIEQRDRRIAELESEIARFRAAPAAGTEKDAGRWRETLMHVGGTYTGSGVRFTLRYLEPVADADIMRGSVAAHFTAAIDAAIEAHTKAGKEKN